MAYVHRKDLASAWLKSFFGLDVQIKGELTLEVEWRAARRTRASSSRLYYKKYDLY